jgi:hypothetical protein
MVVFTTNLWLTVEGYPPVENVTAARIENATVIVTVIVTVTVTVTAALTNG